VHRTRAARCVKLVAGHRAARADDPAADRLSQDAGLGLGDVGHGVKAYSERVRGATSVGNLPRSRWGCGASALVGEMEHDHRELDGPARVARQVELEHELPVPFLAPGLHKIGVPSGVPFDGF
jgi:hypothetical protein